MPSDSRVKQPSHRKCKQFQQLQEPMTMLHELLGNPGAGRAHLAFCHGIPTSWDVKAQASMPAADAPLNYISALGTLSIWWKVQAH